MIDFTTLQGLTIPEGVVTQITDGSGRVIWAVQSESGEPIVLEVEKITSDTYAGETTYTGESFILLDIYPKTNGTVNVTYCGLTKTITDTSGAAEPNAQQVFFGTFNGVSDSVATSASGTLTIEGGCAAFGCGTFASSSKNSNKNCGCVTAFVDLGSVATLKSFASCKSLKSVTLPDSVKSCGTFQACASLESFVIGDGLLLIDSGMFSNCDSLKNLTIGKKVSTIAAGCFSGSNNISNIVVDSKNESFLAMNGILFNKNKTELIVFPTASGDYIIPNGITRIVGYAFYECDKLTSVTIPEGVTSVGGYAFFISNSAIKTLTIPSSVTEVGTYAFAIYGLTSVTILATNPPKPTTTISEYALLGRTASSNFVLTEVIVPKGCGEAYKAAAGWSEYADLIVEAT